MTDYDDMQRATRREWAVAKFVVIGGLIIAVAIAAFFAWKTQHDAAMAQQAEEQQAQDLAKQQQQRQLQMAGATICAVQLVEAKLMGLIPRYGQVTSKMPSMTNKRGRYTCEVATQVSRYRITADLLCAQINHTECTKIVSIQMDDGTVLYKAK